MVTDLTPKQLLILAAVRHLQPTNTRDVADFLNRPLGTINYSFYGNYIGTENLVDRGYVTIEPRKCSTLRLTKLGRAALRDVALIIEGSEVSIGVVEKVKRL